MRTNEYVGTLYFPLSFAVNLKLLFKKIYINSKIYIDGQCGLSLLNESLGENGE